jgi:hypothetical protein
MLSYKRNLPDVIPDNDERYIGMVLGIIESIDELSHVEVSKTPRGYSFRISPSSQIYVNLLINEILEYHNKLGIRIRDISKSIKSTGAIVFKVP